MPADVDTREDYEAMAADERARPRGGASPAPEAGGVN
jgi:hypothetical protein